MKRRDTVRFSFRTHFRYSPGPTAGIASENSLEKCIIFRHLLQLIHSIVNSAKFSDASSETASDFAQTKDSDARSSFRVSSGF